ncbi:unnamed protein product [Staurois parvus]|uniref:Uncharacterized protein n=1 Tax=Staurois parvus TaxID=386267 RepID=A0ABN9FG45_9NEOB|nr:unnamed protein product [Staurois parvus]
MYLNGWTGAVQGRVAVYKCPPCWCALPESAQHRNPVPTVSGLCDH